MAVGALLETGLASLKALPDGRVGVVGVAAGDVVWQGLRQCVLVLEAEGRARRARGDLQTSCQGGEEEENWKHDYGLKDYKRKGSRRVPDTARQTKKKPKVVGYMRCHWDDGAVRHQTIYINKSSPPWRIACCRP